ncbi:MAG: diaminopimelate epimerase [Candidatus Latescibacterota bacterium]|nr:MAG: diaminopimelate epimerase [Candidatus Latescibacterota bacterium]
MKIRFTKMNGAGNDFVMIDNRDGEIQLSERSIRFLCDRKRGVGGDGVITIEQDPDLDFRMRYFNRDGGEAEMCGNGARCAAVFASSLGIGKVADNRTYLRFGTRPGNLEAVVRGSRVAVSMTDATSFEEAVSVPVAQGEEIVHLINTGVPHAVSVEDDWNRLTDEGVLTRGKSIRSHDRFSPAGVNANFVAVRQDGRVVIRTYERGVETETLACGTGAVAGAVVLAHLGLAVSPVRLVTHGEEELEVSFVATPNGATEVVLEGPAAVNFEGSVELSAKE